MEERGSPKCLGMLERAAGWGHEGTFGVPRLRARGSRWVGGSVCAGERGRVGGREGPASGRQEVSAGGQGPTPRPELTLCVCFVSQ